jgi:hypothetical protein
MDNEIFGPASRLAYVTVRTQTIGNFGKNKHFNHDYEKDTEWFWRAKGAFIFNLIPYSGSQ